MKGLFRQQVLEQQACRLHGEVLLLPRFSHSVILLALLVWVAATIFWLANCSYARKETVLGWLEPAEGVLRVYGENPGLIERVLVEEGQLVEDDQPLVIMNGARLLEGGEPLEAVLAQQYRGQKLLLEAQLSREEQVFTSRTERVADGIAALEKSLMLLNAQARLHAQNFSLVRDQVARYRRLRENGHVPAAELEAALASELELQEKSTEIARRRIDVQEELRQLTMEQELLPAEYANSQSAVKARLSDIDQKIAQLEGQQRSVIRAARAGVVTNLQARDGQRVRGNVPLLSLLPPGQKLEAKLLVPVRAAGFLRHGQPLNIRYDAFPFQKFGIYRGNLKEISRTVQLPREMPLAPVPVKGPVFRVTATLDHGTIAAYGKQLELKPGMTLAADIQLAERSLLQWLLEPLYSLRGKL